MKGIFSFLKGAVVCVILMLAYCGLIIIAKPEIAEDYGKRMKGF